MPELLDRPVSRIGEKELFAFGQAGVERSARALQLAEDAGRLRKEGDTAAAEAKEKAAAGSA